MTAKNSHSILIIMLTLLISACTAATTQIEVKEQTGQQTSATTPEAAQEATNLEVSQIVQQQTPTLTVTQPPPSQQPTATSEAVIVEVAAPMLSTELARGCEQKGGGAQSPKEGQPAIDFTLLDPDGNSYTLSELLKEKPVVIIFGSFT